MTAEQAAPATEYTIEQIAEIDNRIRKERKAERERYDTAIKEAIGHFQALDISSCDYIPPNEIAEYLKAMLESLRGGGAP